MLENKLPVDILLSSLSSSHFFDSPRMFARSMMLRKTKKKQQQQKIKKNIGINFYLLACIANFTIINLFYIWD
jgi:hypothetical protein